MPGRGALVSRAQRSTKWCAADPGPQQTPFLGRSRISGAPLRSAIKSSQIVSIYLRCFALHRIRDTQIVRK
jgi:hypothetical protein